MQINHRNNNFDFIRLVLAILVVFAHIFDLNNKSQSFYLLRYISSDFAIKCFFVISGYLITTSYYNNFLNLKKYYINRFSRIYPAYLAVILLSFIFLPIIFQDFDILVNLKYLIVNCIFLNFIQPNLYGVFDNNHINAVNGALWTIKIEVMFYILLPFIINFIHPKKLKIKLIILSGIYLASICYSYFWEHIIIIPFLAKQLPGHMCFFAAGIIAYYTKEYCIKNSQLLLLPAIGIYLLEHYLFHFELITPACLAIMIMFAAYHFKPLNQVGKHGDFSYGIYLIHFPIIQIFVASGYFTNQPITAIVICLICIVLLSVCSWLAIEKPSLNYFKN